MAERTNNIPPNPLYIFRMIHFDNLEYILTNGICCSRHPKADPGYINIGDSSLISQRDNYVVRVDPPGGVLGDYIPFYFAGHTPMLLKIITGYGVDKIPQEDIIFICCKVNDIIDYTNEWCFTDGHAKSAITEYFNDLRFISRVDWNAVKATKWTNDENDFDRTRKKQAEFLVKYFIPVPYISSIIVKNSEKEEEVRSILNRLNINIPIHIDVENNFYYK